MLDDRADGDREPVTRLVLFAAGDEQYAGRRARRQRMLEMQPVDPTEEAEVRPLVAPRGGVHWEYLLADDRPVLVRSRDLGDPEEAEWDARRIFSSGARFRIVYVRDGDGGSMSWWLVRDDEPLLVAPRVWVASQRAAVGRSARRALARLRELPPWGTYEG